MKNKQIFKLFRIILTLLYNSMKFIIKFSKPVGNKQTYIYVQSEGGGRERDSQRTSYLSHHAIVAEIWTKCQISEIYVYFL